MYQAEMADPEKREVRRAKAREYMRRTGNSNPVKNKKAAARLVVKLMVLHGWLAKQPCTACGTATPVEAHHRTYDDPLAIVWLCRFHHQAEHHPHLKAAGSGHAVA